MTVVFELPAEASSQQDVFAIGYSPLAEACFSLRVLVNPSRFRAHSAWARSCRRLLPTDLRRELRELTPLFSHAVPGFLTATTPASSSFAGELERVATVGADDARAEALSVLATLSSMRRSEAGELRRQWIDQPRTALQRIVALLERYWSVAFRSEWERLVPVLRSDAKASSDRLRRGELGPSSKIQLDRHSLTVKRACNRVERVAVAGRQITLSPSSFLWPRVSVESAPPWPLAVFYPLSQRRQRVGANGEEQELLPSLRALADATRLAIIRLIVEWPRSTRELAQLLVLSEGAVSQHLRQLRAAGLVTTKREGHYVLYAVDPRSLRRVAAALAELSSAKGN